MKQPIINDPTFVSAEEVHRQHEQYEFACRVAGEVANLPVGNAEKETPEHCFVIACPGGYLNREGGEACGLNDLDYILIVAWMEAEDLCAGRRDTHRAVKVSVYFDRIEKGWK